MRKKAPVKVQAPNGMVTMELHPQEAALIEGTRRMRFGTIEKLGIHNGLPDVVTQVLTRCDLKSEDERKAWAKGF